MERLVKTADRTGAATSTDGTSAEGAVHAAPLDTDTAVEVRARISGDDGSLFQLPEPTALPNPRCHRGVRADWAG